MGFWPKAALLVFTSPLLAAESFINVTDYKAPDGNWNQAITAAVAQNPGSTIRFPVSGGDYVVDNSNGPLVIRDFTGALSFDPGTRIVCQSTARGCLSILGGSQIKIDNLRIGYASMPQQRIHESAFYAKASSDLRVTGIIVENSPAAGVLISATFRPSVTQAFVTSTLADGISFENCEDATLSDSTTLDTGDDGISFINYENRNVADFPNLTGGIAKNVRVKNSRSRGIAVPGQSNILVSNFVVENTSGSGILVLRDPSFNTRQPANVKFSGGLIVNPGQLAPATATPYGIHYSGVSSVEFDNITVLNAADRGLSGMAAAGRLVARNIHVTGGTDCVNIGQTRSALLSGLTAENCDGYGIFVSTSNNWVAADGLRAINVSRTSPLHRAVWFENNADVRVTGITIIDDQPAPTGYVIGQFRNQRLAVSGVHAMIRESPALFSCPTSSGQIRFVCEGPPY